MKIKDPYAEFQHEKLENGLSIYHLKTDDNFVYAMFNIKAGASSDPIGREGTAHFVEHLISENALLPYDGIRDFFQNLGGSTMLGETYNHMTRYSFKIPVSEEYLRTSFFLFGNMLCESQIIKSVEKERKIILNEYNKRVKVEEVVDIHRKINATVFPNTFSSRAYSPLGNKSFIESATRKELEDFRKKHYIPKNISIVSCGNISFEIIKKIISESVFGKNTEQGDVALENIHNNDNLLKKVSQPFEHEENIFRYCLSDLIKSEIKMISCRYESYALFPGDTDPRLMSLLNKMLSRALLQNIREKENKTYSINANSDFNSESKWISIHCESFDVDFYDKMINAVIQVVESLIDNEDLFLYAVRSEKNAILMSDITNSTIVKQASIELSLYGKILLTKDDLDFCDTVTIEDVNNLLKNLKGKYMYHVLVKP